MSTPIVQYEIKEKLAKNIEIRKYDRILLAKVYNDKEVSQNASFRALFNFISGENSKNQEIQMTAPVFQEISDQKSSMAFIMPKEFDEKNLPKPNDTNVKIQLIENQTFIAIRFSGRSSIKNFKKYQKILENYIKNNNLAIEKLDPIYAYYNAPWALPFFKRNEVLYQLQ